MLSKLQLKEDPDSSSSKAPTEKLVLLWLTQMVSTVPRFTLGSEVYLIISKEKSKELDNSRTKKPFSKAKKNKRVEVATT